MHLPYHKCFAHYVTAENPTCPADDGQDGWASFLVTGVNRGCNQTPTTAQCLHGDLPGVSSSKAP